jgi:2-oxoisovalerate dehydrogenase E1 component alpha subunit
VLGAAVDRARDGGGPSLVEAHTYRMQAHTNADDATRYRSADDVERWVPKDPILRMRTYLKALDLLTEEGEQAFADDADATAAVIRKGLNTEVDVNPAELFEYVYTEKTSQLREQAALLREELARDADAAAARTDGSMEGDQR